MNAFEYTPLGTRVVFGRGTIETVPGEIERLGCKRAFVVSGQGVEAAIANELFSSLGALAGDLTNDAAMHTPVEVTECALDRLRRTSPDVLVSVGGGSSTGLSKALALRTGLPQVAIPTTYAGSEATPILGQTEDGRKTTMRGPEILPRTIVYDVDLTMGLPARLSSTSGMNAMAHAVEALYARDASPISDLMAIEAIRTLGRALPRIVDDPADATARSDALYSAWLCGTCLGMVGMSLHHKLCHVLGGSFDLPHAETHTVILPYVAAYNAVAAPEALGKVSSALDAKDAGSGLFALNRRLDAPCSLEALGMRETDLDEAARIATSSPYWNPRAIDVTSIRALLYDAWIGRPPETGEYPYA